MLPLFADARRPAGDRRGALHQRLGARLPARLPAPGGDAPPAARRRGGAVHDGDGERPRGRRRRGAARVGAAEDLPRPARAAPACASRSSTCPARPTASRGSRRWLPQLPGSGIVYTLTKRDAELVADWLSAPRDRRRGLQRRDRERAADRRSRSGCWRNDLKAVVATSALGMGYDKPDLGFVVHYQAPGSVISYYQQVGRAGRGVDRAEVVLLRGARGPPDPGLLHPAGVPAARAGRARARAARRTAARRRAS